VATLLQTLGEVLTSEYELRTIHKLLHVFSKLLFYFCVALFLQSLIQGACALPTIKAFCSITESIFQDKIFSFIFFVFLTLLSLALAIGKKEELASFLLSELDVNMKELSDVLSVVKPKTPFLDIEILHAISRWFDTFSAENITIRNIIKTPYFKTSLLINFLLMPVAVLSLIISSWYVPAHQLTLILAILLFALAIIVSCINTWLILPKCGSSTPPGTREKNKRDVLGKSLNLLFLVLLGRYRYCIEDNLNSLEKILLIAAFSIGLTVIAGPSDLLLPSKKRDMDLQPQTARKSIAFVFTPTLRDIEGLPAKCLEKGTQEHENKGRSSTKDKNTVDRDIDLLSRICKEAYEEIGLAPNYAEYPSKKTSDMPFKETYTICTSVDLAEHKKEVWSEVIQRSESALSDVRAKIEALLSNWLSEIEYLSFDDLKSLLGNNENADKIIESLYRYSIVESSRETWSNVKSVERLLELLSNAELIKDLRDLSEKFMIVLPIAYIHTETISEQVIKSSQKRGGSQLVPEKVYFKAYYCIPVLIALNQLMKLQDVKELHEKIKHAKQETSRQG
jgi:hypothetical protein